MASGDSICDKAIDICEQSENLLDSIIGQLQNATNALNAQQAGDVVNPADLNVHILDKDVAVDSPALSIVMQNAFTKLPADKAARVAAEDNKMAEKIQRYTA